MATVLTWSYEKQEDQATDDLISLLKQKRF